MKQYVILILCLVVLNIGVICLFYANKIVRNNKIKNKLRFAKVCKTSGFVVSIIALLAIYFLF